VSALVSAAGDYELISSLDPELDFSNDDDLVLKGDDTQRMDGSDDYDPEREFKQIEVCEL
jgi:hypothetical protein